MHAIVHPFLGRRDVRFGSKADMRARSAHLHKGFYQLANKVRYAPDRKKAKSRRAVGVGCRMESLKAFAKCG